MKSTNLFIPSAVFTALGFNFTFNKLPFVSKTLSNLLKLFNTAVGPNISLPNIGERPPSASCSPEYLPSGVAPTTSPKGI